MRFDERRQRALIERLGDAIEIPRDDEVAASRSVRAQVKEKTNVDISDDVALWYIRNRRAS